MTDLSFYVPHISREGLDAEATAFLKAYCPDAIKTPMCIPIESIAADKMKLTVLEYHLSEDLSILGQMCFTDGKAEIYDPDKEEYREITVRDTAKNNGYHRPATEKMLSPLRTWTLRRSFMPVKLKTGVSAI